MSEPVGGQTESSMSMYVMIMTIIRDQPYSQFQGHDIFREVGHLA